MLTSGQIPFERLMCNFPYASELILIQVTFFNVYPIYHLNFCILKFIKANNLDDDLFLTSFLNGVDYLQLFLYYFKKVVSTRVLLLNRAYGLTRAIMDAYFCKTEKYRMTYFCINFSVSWNIMFTILSTLFDDHLAKEDSRCL